jgi:citrate lyase subunit beta/citryl-CoA lyase
MRRSLIYTPGSDAHKCEKALTLPCDTVIFDLEDAVSPSMKQAARDMVCGLLWKLAGTNKEIMVRVNQISTLTGVEDLLAVTACPVDCIVVPKACVNDIITADSLVTSVEQSRGLKPVNIRLIGLIETVLGLEQLSDLVRITRRLDGIQLGAEDLTRELGIVRTTGGVEIAYARNKMVITGRAYGLDVIDTPYTNYKDSEGLKADIAYIVRIGMHAKTAIHPIQIGAINAAFTPALEEVEDAQRVVALYEKALAEGKGACSLDGKMIDAPVAERARKLLAKMEQFGNQ